MRGCAVAGFPAERTTINVRQSSQKNAVDAHGIYGVASRCIMCTVASVCVVMAAARPHLDNERICAEVALEQELDTMQERLLRPVIVGFAVVCALLEDLGTVNHRPCDLSHCPAHGEDELEMICTIHRRPALL